MIDDVYEREAGLPHIETAQEKILPRSRIEEGQLIIFDSPLFTNQENGILDSLDGGIHPLLEDYALLYRSVWKWKDKNSIVLESYPEDSWRQRGIRHSKSFELCWYDRDDGRVHLKANDDMYVNCPNCLKYMKIRKGGMYLILSSMDRPMDILDVKSPDTLDVLKRLGFLPKRREKIVRVDKFRRVDSYPFQIMKYQKDEDHSPVFEEKSKLRRDSARRIVDYQYRSFKEDSE